MQYEQPELTMDENLRLAALQPITRMMEISKKAGLIG
jgi:quinolinate synthase